MIRRSFNIFKRTENSEKSNTNQNLARCNMKQRIYTYENDHFTVPTVSRNISSGNKSCLQISKQCKILRTYPKTVP